MVFTERRVIKMTEIAHLDASCIQRVSMAV